MSTEGFLNSPAALELPTLIELKNPTVAFTDSSVFEVKHHTFEAPIGPDTDYGQTEHVGDASIGFVVTELVSELYPLITVQSAAELRNRCVNNEDALANLSLHYKLPEKLESARAQLEARTALRLNNQVHSDLFESYAEALRLEIGNGPARLWLREVYRPLIKYHYDALEQALFTFEPASPGTGVAIAVGKKRNVEDMESGETEVDRSVKRIQLPPTTADNSLEPESKESWAAILARWSVQEKGSKFEFAGVERIGTKHDGTSYCTCVATRGYAFKVPKQPTEPANKIIEVESNKPEAEESRVINKPTVEVKRELGAFEKIGTVIKKQAVIEYEEAPKLVYRGIGENKKSARHSAAEGMCKLLGFE